MLRMLLAASLAVCLGCGSDPPMKVVPAAKEAADPYPECAAVRAHLNDNLASPDSLRIVRWGKRSLSESDGPLGWPKGTIVIPLKYRFTNEMGGPSISSQQFLISPDGKKIIRILDWTASE